jgi:hypothetical protein
MIAFCYQPLTGVAVTAASQEALLLRFKPTDTKTAASRATVSKLARHFGYERESEVIHYALLKLAQESLPYYEPDDGPVHSSILAAIKRAQPQGKNKSVRSSLF